jgi:hypothetical protein
VNSLPELEDEAERLLRRVASGRLPVDAGGVARIAALIRAVYEAGRKSVRDEQQALANEIIGELEADEPAEPGTVGALHDFLIHHPRDRKVILRKDAEGNGHSPLADAWEGIYEPDSTYSGEVYPTAGDVAAWVRSGAWTQQDADELYEPGVNAERVVVLGPVN